MLEKPDISHSEIILCLQSAYGLTVTEVTFLPLGADVNTVVYRAIADDGATYFVKLRRGRFDTLSVTLPKWLSDRGIQSIITPLTTKTGQLWAELGNFTLILYPFIVGKNVYEVPLSEAHWQAFGKALRSIHAAALPPSILTQIQRETFTPHWREAVKEFLAQTLNTAYVDPVAREVGKLLQTHHDEITALVNRTETLAQILQNQPPEFVICHTDLHAGNLLINGDVLYIVDWDNPILAPKERDLMYVGGGWMNNWRIPKEEEALFYPAYGQTDINPIALAYYRYERVIQDIAAFCEELLLTDAGGDDRAQSLYYLQSNFRPGNVLEIAYQSDSAKGQAE